MSLVNRQGSNLNRKKITIESATNGLNQGSVIYANIERADSPTTIGTELTAENLENAIVSIVNERIPTTTTSTQVAETKCVCTSDTSVATTEFVWNVLTALGLNKINHNHTSTSTGTGSSSGDSGSSGGSSGSSGT